MSSSPPKHSLSSPTSGNTPHPVLPTPSSSTSVSIRQKNYNKTAQLRQELEQQLVEKQKQLQESSSGIGKNVLARQVSQLQDRLKDMDSTDNSSNELLQQTQPASVDRLRSLERDLSSYRTHPLSPGISSMRNKEKLLNQRSISATNNNSNSTGLDPLPSPSTSALLPPPPTHGHDSTSLLPLPPPPTGSTPTKRRSKVPNTDRRNTDIEFATEIGQGLLLEVRKMQALLQEKEEKLRTLENQKADLERAAEAMAKQMRQREENEEKLKEETWNLELAKQELTISVTELQQNLSKANVEQNKLAKQVNELRSEIEHLRDSEQKLTNTIDNMKQRHEQDMSSIRRHAAAIQREKTDQTKEIEKLTSELAIAKAQSRIGKHVSTESEPSARSGETVDDQTASILAVNNDASPSISPPSSPKQSPARNQAMEVETLKTSLAHAHRMVSNLRSNLHKEKTEKFEFKKLLAESQETIEQLQNDPRMWVDAGSNRGGSGSTSNVAARGEDGGLVPGRRSHKASTSSSKRRAGGKKSAAGGRHKLKGPSSQNATADDDSVYSYSSMSDQDDSESVDSFDDSDTGFDNTNNIGKKKSVGFTPLFSELSQVHMQKPVMVDAEVNTDPIDDFVLPVPVTNGDKSTTTTEPRSLGDELGMAMSKNTLDQEDGKAPITTSMKNMAGGLVAGAATALGVESLMKNIGVEISTQTDVPEEPVFTPGVEVSIQTDEEQKAQVVEMSIQTDSRKLEQSTMSIMSVEPQKPTELEYVSQDINAVEPEDPSIALATTEAAIAAAILASRQSALEAAVDSSTQSDPEDPSIAEATTNAAIAASRQSALDAAVDSITQSDPEDSSIAEAATAAAVAAGIAAFRQSALEAAIDTSVQCDAPEPEDPSIAEAALAAAVAAGITASRSASLEAAIDTSIQCDQPETEDPSIAIAATAAAVAAGIAASRSAAMEAAINTSTQCDDPSVVDQETQIDEVISVDSGVQSIPVDTVDAFIQSEAEDTTATDIQGIVVPEELAAQVKPVETAECGVQSDEPCTTDAFVQHEVESTDIGVQCEDLASGNKSAAAVIPIPPVSSRTFSDSEDEFFDATSDSKPSSRRTVNNLASIAALNNMKPEPRNSKFGNADVTLPIGQDNSGEKDHDAIIVATTAATAAAAAAAAAALASSALMHNKSASGNEDSAEPNRSIASEINNNANNAAAFQLTPHEDKEVQELYNAAPSEKMYSKAETDALIATAVALVLAKVTGGKKTDVGEDKVFDASDDTKRHTCDMSNNQDADSAVVSPSSAIPGVPRTEEDENDDDEDYGDVVVHWAREEDTITSLPYDEIAQQKRHRDLNTSSNQAQKPQEIKENKQQQQTELTLGPSIVFAQEPEEPELTEADVPQRPANPPPTALLNRAGLSPTFTDNRSMSPTSMRSKGKAPLNDYSDLESTSAPSHEDLQRTAALQQLQQHQDANNNKRHSLASSISTNNTNEQAHSIHYSDAVARSNAATDPTMINLITQTMIGDWLWKYTRRAVGGGLSENRHKRYFWMHPYTRTLYWSSSAPGVDGMEAKAKSALIENITSVPDHHNANDGTPNVSLLVQTSHRQLKLTAPNMEKHELWFEAISHLLARNKAGNGLTTLLNNDTKNKNPNNRSISSGTSGSLLNRPSFRRLHDIFQQPSTSSAAPSMVTSTTDADHIELDDEDDEALEDVRMCCNGKHHVSKLEKDRTHRHQYRKRKSRNNNGAIATIG